MRRIAPIKRAVLGIAVIAGLVIAFAAACATPDPGETAAEATVAEVVQTPPQPAPAESPAEGPLGRFQNGRYRGIYEDRGDQQVSIQFTLTDNVISNVSYRHLYHNGINYRESTDHEMISAIARQHQAIAESLEGRPVEAITDLYDTGAMIGSGYDIDGATAATVRGNKIFSAMMDGLNRGLYVPAHENFSRVIGRYQDGRYRGIYGDRGDQQVSIQFHLRDNTLYNLSYRHLYHSGIDYRHDHDDEWTLAVIRQHAVILEALDGAPLEKIFDLHQPGEMVGSEYDIDGATAATVRGNKIFSAIRDGLNRGIYVPPNGFERPLPAYRDGRYRGIYGDRGDQQVSIQFFIEDGLIRNVTYRHLYHSGIDYRDDHDDEWTLAVIRQHDAIREYLEGKPVEAIYDLHMPGMVIGSDYDVDGATGATVRGNKIFSAMIDGLNRGVY